MVTCQPLIATGARPVDGGQRDRRRDRLRLDATGQPVDLTALALDRVRWTIDDISIFVDHTGTDY
jgi:hypothetical protein